jgi:hypothetical protein
MPTPGKETETQAFLVNQFQEAVDLFNSWSNQD